ncbi:hypothetical protein ACVI1J_000353 [Bradyrhizobium diazoefficiens]
MSETRADRVRRIRDILECGMHRAVEIDRAVQLLDYIDRAEALDPSNLMMNVMRQVVLDQYNVRNLDLGKING